MLRLLYTTVFILALPFIFARLWWKEKKVPGYRIRWLQRLGVFRPLHVPRPVVWVHAVSVGEVIAATPLIRRLLNEGTVTLMVTTMTPTGSARVTAAFAGEVAHVYAPFDLPWTVAAFIRRTKPILTIIMETEIWPNMLIECSRRKVPMILANARLSARSARRYGWFAKTTRTFFDLLDHVAVQNEVDGKRFLELGVKPAKLTVTGSVKFDVSLTERLRSHAYRLKQTYSLAGRRRIVIAASTHEGEEALLADAFAQLLANDANLLLLVVPRHPERFDDIYALFAKRFNTLRRSRGADPAPTTQVVLGDTMGELMLLYGVADIAFVGGSLIIRGGHNMIEPAAWGVPVLSGPHVFNFSEISKGLGEAGGLQLVANVDELVRALTQLLTSPSQRQVMGAAAAAYVAQNRGALDQLMTLSRRYTAPGDALL